VLGVAAISQLKRSTTECIRVGNHDNVSTIDRERERVTLTHNTTTTVIQPFVRDYPGEPVPEETLILPPS